MAKLPNKRDLFAGGTWVLALVAEVMDFHPFAIAAFGTIGFLFWLGALWKWAAEFRHQHKAKQQREGLKLRLVLVGLFVAVWALVVLTYLGYQGYQLIAPPITPFVAAQCPQESVPLDVKAREPPTHSISIRSGAIKCAYSHPCPEAGSGPMKARFSESNIAVNS